MSDDLQNFDGTTRLFPLPNLVLFPFVIQPLHIFEPRYRQMTADALGGDRLITIVLLRPGWEEKYSDCPALHGVGCLGRIVADQRLEDGRYNLLLRGLVRVRIVGEIETEKLYRSARVEVITDVPPHAPAIQQQLRQKLGHEAARWLGGKPEMFQQFQRLIDSDLSLGSLADIFSFALPIEPELKQQLLEEPEAERRTRSLLEHLHGLTPPVPAPETERQFPPSFSAN